MRNIVALSGGLASAYCVKLLQDENAENVLLYFNDVKWENPDLYRFLNDISSFFNLPIFNDSDGRNPEELFFDNRFLGNSRGALCSKILKAERLQKFIQDGDVITFGINKEEGHRAERIIQVYQNIMTKKKIEICLRFPLIEKDINSETVKQFFIDNKIEIPELYRKGFLHNNCSGGCVRQGKSQWRKLLIEYPEVYKSRELTEIKVGEFLKRRVTFLKDVSLKELRELIEKDTTIDLFDDSDIVTDCIGICNYRF